MKHHTGRVEVICGSMFSGKTEELIRRVRRAIIAKQEAQVFKPEVDTRYSIKSVTSHDGQGFEAIPIADARDIFTRLHAEKHPEILPREDQLNLLVDLEGFVRIVDPRRQIEQPIDLLLVWEDVPKGSATMPRVEPPRRPQ